MRKTFVYILLLAILGFGVYYFLFNNNDQYFALNEAGFTVKDTGAIGKVYIAGPNGSSILLERSDSGWMVNKQYKALAGTLRILFITLTKQMPSAPVAKSKYNGVIKDLAGNGIKVELYNRGGEKMRVFYVGGEANGDEGSYMLIDGAKTPYVVNIPGFKGYLTPVYSYKLLDWRDRTVFNIPPEQLESVSIQYPDHEESSFVLKQEKGKISVSGDPRITTGTFNERRAHVYSKYFQNINCEGYISNNKDVDSILQIMPKRCAIDIKSIKGQQQHVDIYWLPLNRRSKNMGLEDPNVPDNSKYDADHFYAVMNNKKDTAIITSNVFDKIFKRAYEFYQPDEDPSTTAPVPVEQHKDPQLLPVPMQAPTK